MFEGLSVKLPIKRVIVGPSRAQEQNFRFATDLFGTEIPVSRSATPYVEPGG